MKPLQLYDVPSLLTVDDVLDKLDEALAELEVTSSELTTATDIETMQANIRTLKLYYERAERLMLDARDEVTQ